MKWTDWVNYLQLELFSNFRSEEKRRGLESELKLLLEENCELFSKIKLLEDMHNDNNSKEGITEYPVSSSLQSVGKMYTHWYLYGHNSAKQFNESRRKSLTAEFWNTSYNKMRIELNYSYNWCLWSSYNFFKAVLNNHMQCIDYSINRPSFT